MLKNFEYCAPATIEEALTLLGRAGARPIAGGTDLLIHMQSGVTSPRYLVDLSCLGLSYIRIEADVIKIGAMTTVEELLASEAIRRVLVWWKRQRSLGRSRPGIWLPLVVICALQCLRPIWLRPCWF